MYRLFLYGTLKRGGSNHHFVRGQRFIAVAHTVPAYRLYSLGDYPGLVAVPPAEIGRAIEGELWDVDAACLRELDELEGLREGLYLRQAVALQPPHADSPAQTYLYARDLTGHPEVGERWAV